MRRGRAGLYALGSVHSVGFLGSVRPGQERTAAGGTHLKVPVRVGSKHSESRVRHGEGSPGPVAPQVVSCPAQPLPPLQLPPEGVRAGGSGASSLGGLVSAFTKCRLTCLQGERGSEPKLALEHGRRSENLQGRKKRVSWVALAWATSAQPPPLVEALSLSVCMICLDPHNNSISFHRRGNRTSGKLSNLPNVTVLSGRA